MESSTTTMSRIVSSLPCTLVILVAGHVCAAEPLAWQADYASAVEQAQQMDKMLLVVQLESDFTEPAAASREANVYNVYSLSGREVPAFLHQHFVAVRLAVGASQVLRVVPKGARSPTPRDGAVVAWFCTPRERVVHVVPGYVSPGKMLAEAKWAHELYGDIADILEPPGFPEAKAAQVRQQHRIERDESEPQNK